MWGLGPWMLDPHGELAAELLVGGEVVEHLVGHGLFIGFYVAAGIVASFAQILLDTTSVIPTLAWARSNWVDA